MTTDIKDYDRMFTYVWGEKTEQNEGKFGERWVFAGQDPMTEVRKRVKESLGVRKDKFNDGSVTIHAIWDVTELAKTVKRYYQRSRMDDYIRPHIGHRKGSTGEVHELSPAEIKLRVDKYLAKSNQPLPVVALTRNQANAAEEVITAIKEGSRTILAELCARFGKTIWAGALVRETNAQLTVITSYVLTSFASFEKDLSGFEQFKDLVLIDTADADYQDVINTALEQGKQVVAFLSMCAGGRRQERIDFLFGLEHNRLVCIDEADFGVHQQKQVDALKNARGSNDVVIIMTGTNSDKAASTWEADYFLSVTYPELVIEKKLGSKDTKTNLTHFKVDPSRHNLVVDMELYQMDLKGAVDYTIAQDPGLDRSELASWAKFAASPIKAKGLWTNILQAVFEAKHGLDELNIDLQTNDVPAHRVAMMFLPGSTGVANGNLALIGRMAQDALKGFVVITVSGEDMTNRDAERLVKEQIEKAKKQNQSVLILSAGMAQRSFSVGEITELYLAYDNGDSGATIQKISRALTPHTLGKVGRIISLSFDPNRDDKFDDVVMITAQNFQKTHGGDMRQALETVLRTLDIFKCTANGGVKLLRDEYLEELIATGRLTRVIGKISDTSKLTPEAIVALATGNVDVYRQAMTEAAQKGKTRNGKLMINGKAATTASFQKMLAEAKKMITTIVENLDILTYGTSSANIHEALVKLSANPVKQAEVKKHFGVDFFIINDLFEREIINSRMVELLEKDKV